MRQHTHNIMLKLLTALSATGLLAGCAHEHECWCAWPPADRAALEVAYSWAAAEPERLPEGMTLMLYPTDGADYWLHTLPPLGGEAPVPPGIYDIVSYNSDTENIVIGGTSSLSTLEAYTLPARLTDGLPEAYTGPQPPSRDGDEPVCRQPDMMWLADSAGLDLRVIGRKYTVTLQPRPIVGCYTIIIDDVTNIASASGMSVSLSGLAPGYMLGLGRRADGAVTQPGSIATASATSIAGQMLTFGPAITRPENTLCLYVWLRDGTKREYRWDVTDQIEHPADGHSLTIHISGLELPEVTGPNPPSGSGGGMSVDVDNWETIEIELST